MSRRPLLPCMCSGMEGISMYDLTIDDCPSDRLAAMVHWRNDPVVNRYVRQGILTLEEVQAWYTQYFSRAENKLFTVYCDKALIGYGTLSHIDPTQRSGEIGMVIGDPHYGNKGLGAMVIKQLTTLALTRDHLHRVLLTCANCCCKARARSCRINRPRNSAVSAVESWRSRSISSMRCWCARSRSFWSRSRL